MRLVVFLVLAVALLTTRGTGLVSAEDSASDKSKRIALNKIIKRLRGSHKSVAEERVSVAPVDAYWFAATQMNRPSRINSQSIVHAVEHHEPLPKWVTALVVILGLGVVGGGVYGVIKAAHALNK
ncbi:hypothetical protein PHYSODRAFT_251351 [Phytophthora sojae]|uniref:RxLR effector protein n=1 Tax=Phytophthora sojae (strain P6497) TaxID=1094619 RepID=G4Z9E0_PHYSP|nr:hypothetical protein PHYSODRAFT_251351 [Phytophthora sojae]EGZ21941.1 hypothetical protein PHYSODRAFT_251351 [Phytophthora sojae]|eukprot:XP_009524658.1 hypothetical protein PHYSODRAFT_251351 [Phytophthora sojae]